MAAVPADPHAIARFPLRYIFTHCVDLAGHLVARDARQLEARIGPKFHHCVTVANATGLDLDAHLIGARRRHLALHYFERPVCFGNLNGSHLRHDPPPR